MSLSIQASVYQPYTELVRPQSGREPGSEPDASAKSAEAGGKASAQVQAQSEQDKKIVDELKSRDREVRAHEQAHVAAAGGLAQGGPSYTYQYGPDGQAYAVGGEVNIDTSPGRTPQETISKAKQIRAAALAPADPSDQDRAVAAAAAQLEAQAQQELTQQTTEKTLKTATSSPTSVDGEAPTEPSENSVENDKARQNATIYSLIAAATTPGARINVSA